MKNVISSIAWTSTINARRRQEQQAVVLALRRPRPFMVSAESTTVRPVAAITVRVRKSASSSRRTEPWKPSEGRGMPVAAVWERPRNTVASANASAK
jgi:hypothetical protein